MTYESKPRIYRMRPFGRRPACWVCRSFDDRGGTWSGYGDTATEAYVDWREGPFA